MDHPPPRTHRLVVAGKHVLRYAITDLGGQASVYGLDQPADREVHLRAQVRRWAVDGVDIVQLREKQLESGELYDLSCMALSEIRRTPSGHTRLVINGRADIAAAAGADGVHLTSGPGELSPAQVRSVFRAAQSSGCLLSVSCHTVEEVESTRDGRADLILFGPVFEKQLGGDRVLSGMGLEQLGRACSAAGETPLLALGGVDQHNLDSCLREGAAGFASIRLFQ